jgi:hypothetical protein
MATREKRLLEQLIKQWAQDHCVGYTIANYENTQEAMNQSSSHFTWVIREGHASIDLQNLVDRLEAFLQMKRSRKFPDGMFCKSCNNFYQFAESNQDDGSLICYSCQHPCG